MKNYIFIGIIIAAVVILYIIYKKNKTPASTTQPPSQSPTSSGPLVSTGPADNSLPNQLLPPEGNATQIPQSYLLV